MPNAVIFDYGVGNLLSLKTALDKAGFDASVGTTAAELAKADAIALPGVGSFTAASSKLDAVKEILQPKFRGHAASGHLSGVAVFLKPARRTGTGLALFKDDASILAPVRFQHGLEHT
jgi:imidazoleglycerol phosphate synthase glutamine amidotransferase subunit HisH